MRVYFTVDTETSMNGAWRSPERRPLQSSRRVFCRIGNEDFGIPLLTRILRTYGFRSTFFVETLATECLGDADMRSIFDFLLHDGQDVQLHTHPNFWFYSKLQKARAAGREYRVPRPSDFLGHFEREVQRDLLHVATRHFQKMSGYRPAAFRAGCFAASRETLACLHELGVTVDSSFNPCLPEVSFSGESFAANALQRAEGVWEMPVTVMRTKLPEGHAGWKPADYGALSFAEIRHALDAAEAAGQRYFVIVFHSFSTVKSRDEAYSEMRPNRIVIRRVEQLFHYLADNGCRFQVDTMGSLAARLNESGDAGKHQAHVPELPLLRSVVRKAVQGVNRLYWV